MVVGDEDGPSVGDQDGTTVGVIEASLVGAKDGAKDIVGTKVGANVAPPMAKSLLSVRSKSPPSKPRIGSPFQKPL